MKKTDLKNGMIYETRNGKLHYIIESTVYIHEKSSLIIDCFLCTKLNYYNDDLKHESDSDLDIVCIYDADKNIVHIEDVDWTKVPVDTKIYVKNHKGGEFIWLPKHFAKYENGKIYTFQGSRWTSENQELEAWKKGILAEHI